ncbi:TasA family protein [Neobacillus jeddahensis]|uniref:TasA family protein n=1 Tax=Neobacillus jeddahensis TaxID=1461580 RepID=UPI00058AFF0D|nr:TasA family protein [Neobacillus jeddahensis]
MGIKKKLGLGLASAALGLSLVGGGTFAYFNDVETSNNTFAAGTLNLTLNPTQMFKIQNMKPGDKMFKRFNLKNDGSLNIKNVLLQTDYTVHDANNNNGTSDFADDIEVTFLEYEGAWPGNPPLDQWDDLQGVKVVSKMTLKQLSELDPADLSTVANLLPQGSLAPNKDVYLTVQLEFKDKGNQNQFQGDSLDLDWTFTANQEAGTWK